MPTKNTEFLGKIPIKIPIHRIVNFNNIAEGVKNIFVQQEVENSNILHNFIHLK